MITQPFYTNNPERRTLESSTNLCPLPATPEPSSSTRLLIFGYITSQLSSPPRPIWVPFPLAQAWFPTYFSLDTHPIPCSYPSAPSAPQISSMALHPLREAPAENNRHVGGQVAGNHFRPSAAAANYSSTHLSPSQDDFQGGVCLSIRVSHQYDKSRKGLGPSPFAKLAYPRVEAERGPNVQCCDGLDGGLALQGQSSDAQELPSVASLWDGPRRRAVRQVSRQRGMCGMSGESRWFPFCGGKEGLMRFG